MDERNERVIRSFINVVQKGKKDYDSAVLLIEDTQKYGYLTEADKQAFYDAFEEPDPIPEDMVMGQNRAL